MIRKIIVLVLLLLIQTGCSLDREERLLGQIEAMMELPESKIDVAKAKLTIDKIIDPSIDVKTCLRKIDDIALQIKEFSGDEAIGTSNITEFLYTKGSWNNHEIYDYYDEKVITSDIKASLLSTYIDTKRGNCVAMPVLHYLVASKLGLDVYLTHVPTHILFKFKNKDGEFSNIETTDFGRVNPDSFYIKHMAITDKAMQNKLYLQPLNKREVLSILVTKLTVFYAKNKEYEKALAMSDLALKHFPNLVTAMVQKADVIAKIYARETEEAEKIGLEPDQEYVASLDQQYGSLYGRARELGWQEKPKTLTEQLVEMLVARMNKK
jgi:regulator of sirC expression with transglutaminase-like and TPR domain